MAELEYEFDNELEALLKMQGMDKEVQKMVRTVLKKASKQLSGSIHSAIGNDPRQAYKAVRHMVYKRILGGNLNILTSKRGTAQKNAYDKPRKLRPGQRGGNRTPQSQRTRDLNAYYGKDRGFVLRFLNSGTSDRHNGYRNTGSIAPRAFFLSNAQSAMNDAMGELCTLIDEEYKKILK